ncbi:MAG: TonB-dependent receptor [Bacteroidales bacterium]
MKINWYLLLLALITTFTAQAQFVKIAGTVVDRETGEPLIAATVRAIASEGAEETFSITNDKGIFNIEVPRPGPYKLEFSYIGYKKLSRSLNVRPGDNAIGKIRLTEDAIELKNTQVIGKNMRVKQMADTTVYNADGYKVKAGATGEELLAKMPGMKISDGKIEAQGEEVKKVLVDGKPFFENDPTLALKTLPAEVIQSIAVFDKMSDQAELTGFDDGNSVKALDVRTRSFKRNGVFGKLYGQYGTDSRYNVGGNVNVFQGDRRFTVMGLFNNVNQQNFSIDDILGAMSSGKKPGQGGPPPMGGSGGPDGRRQLESMGTQSGVTSANALGLNYSDTWGDKLEIQGSYFFNMTRNTLSDSLNRNYFDTLGGKRIYDQLSNSLTNNYSHRFNMRMIYKPTVNDEIMFLPNMNFQKNDAESLSENHTLLNQVEQNSSETDKRSAAHGYNLAADLIWRHKFDKKGRTFSVVMRGGLSKNDADSEADIVLNEQKSRQEIEQNTDGYSWGANVMYTEPIRDNQQLSASYNANFANTHTNKVTNNVEDELLTTDPYLSSRYRSDYLTQAVGVGYRVNSDKLKFMANVNLQRADLDGKQQFPYNEALSYITSKTYNSVLPMLMLDYNPVKNHAIRVMYRSNSSSPSVSQLQQTIDNSDPLQLYQGNPELNQVVEHALSVRYIASNIQKATNWMAFVSVSKKFDYIGSEVTLFNEDATIDNGIQVSKGAQLSRPVNLDGYLNLRSNLTYGFPIDFLMSNMNLSAGVNYSQTPGIQNGLSLKTRSLSFIPEMVLTSNISEDIDFTLSYNADFQKVNNNLQKNSNYDYLTHTAKGKISWVIWKGITVENNLDWKCYAGSAMDKKEQFWIWNASLGKKFLKQNRAELKLSAYDILKQNRAFTRTIADAYIQNSYTNVLSRYFMVTFTYNLQHFKGAGVNKQAKNIQG